MWLTEAEVAERLRCSKQKVRTLRLGGKLRYIPGRPPLIDEADLNAYLQAEKLEAAGKVNRKQRAIQRARHMWLQRQMKERSK